MARRHLLQHEFENGCTVICVMDALNVPHAWAGENINVNNWDWSQTAEHTVLKWQTDSGHLANMLNCHYTRFGAGVDREPGGRHLLQHGVRGRRGLLASRPARLGARAGHA